MYNKIINWWCSQNIKTSRDFETILDNFRIAFACHSYRIEGSTVDYYTTREISEGNSLLNFNGTAREIFEVQNQKFSFRGV